MVGTKSGSNQKLSREESHETSELFPGTPFRVCQVKVCSNRILGEEVEPSNACMIFHEEHGADDWSC
eukprot:9247417-Heterocapsa_arctica.AAC.1